MFVQVIQGHVSDAAQVPRSLTDGSRRWPLEPWDGWAAHPGLLTTEG
jgi:hypothetical protein